MEKANRAAIAGIVLALSIRGVCSAAGAETRPETPTEIGLTWSTIASLVIPTGLLTAFFNQVMEYFGEARVRKRSARSLAFKLINELETFANACSHELAQTHYDSDVSGEEFLPNHIPELPALRPLGDDEQWGAINKHLGTRATTMNSERDQSLQRVEIALSLLHQEHEEDFVFRNFYEQVSNIGLEAAYLARDLRSKYASGAKPEDSITGTIATLEKERADLAQSAHAGSVKLD